MSTKWDSDEVIQRFREYLRIPSVHPDINYNDCVQFLKKQGEQLDLPVVVYELVPKKPVVVITWKGLEPEQPSILLNSHMDVVPVYEEHWTYPPFEAVISDDGFIYARGTQDMKSIGMMHLEAIRRLKAAGVKLKRTIHISFVPDEETGSVDGMRVFAASNEFKKLKVGFELDESGPSSLPNDIFVCHGERTSIEILVTCRAPPGHGMLFTSGSDCTAGEKLRYIINKFMEFREGEHEKVKNGAWIGDVTTVNLTQIQGGVQGNVLPESLSVTFDIRVACDVDLDEFHSMITRWCTEAGRNVTFEYVLKNPKVQNTNLDENLPFWNVMKKAVNEMGLSIRAAICPGATDARYIRQQGIPAINFSPLINTPLLLHAHDEKVHVDIYKKGIDIMEKVVKEVANV